MTKYKTLIAFIMALALVALQIGVARAAPAQATLPDGTIVSITQSTDSSNNTIFVVVVKDSTGTDHTVNLTPAEAEAAGLVTANSGGTFTINGAAGGTISGGKLVTQTNPCASTTTTGNPVATALTAFFCALQGSSTVVDQSIESLHTQGFGFGEIAQACFMADVLKTTCSAILDAKQSHDFTSLDTALSGAGFSCTPTNWGQLKKCALDSEVKSLTNLGAIMSGRAGTPTGGGQGNGNGSTHGNGHGNGNGNGHGNGHQP
ncbi:MAG TPA: hypothetical protein VF784_04475 [Anaerolineales bacterium]